jgi:hypothetical protein
MDYGKIAGKLREQMVRFSGELSRGLPKVVGRFIAEMLYGVQARQSVRLTEVSRALDEPIAIKKTVERLSRQLGNPALWTTLTDRLLERAAPQVRETTLLILDLSDVHKKYAQKMEHLATVWDGSEKTKNRGYTTLHIVAAETNSAQIVPLYGRLFSPRAPEYTSENVELRQAIRRVAEKTGKRGLWLLDRGGDRGYLYDYLLPEGLRFVIRLRGDRTLVTDRPEAAREAARQCPLLFNEYIVRETTREEKPLRLEVGCRKVSLPGRREELTLVVVRGFGEEPLMLLTNLRLTRARKALWHVVSAYLTRWRIEETLRHLKQSYQLEDIRVLRYVRLQNMMAILMAVVYFTAVYLGIKLKLRVLAGHLIKAARRVFGIPQFRLYALADGIRHLLFNRTHGLGAPPPPPEPAYQQRLLFSS